MNVCKTCNKSFNTKASLKRHLNKKNPCDKRCICDLCGRICPNFSRLKKHKNENKNNCKNTSNYINLCYELENSKKLIKIYELLLKKHNIEFNENIIIK